MRTLAWINFILGLWLIVAGFALSGGVSAVLAEEVSVGIIIAALACSSALRPTAPLSWLVVLAGLWALVAPAVINYTGSHGSRANDVIVGIVVIVLGIANAVYRRSPVRNPA